MSKNPETLKGIDPRLLKLEDLYLHSISPDDPRLRQFLFLAQQFFDSIKDYSLNLIREEIFPVQYAKQLETISYIANHLNTGNIAVPEPIKQAEGEIKDIIKLYHHFALGKYNQRDFKFNNPILLHNACLQYFKVAKEDILKQGARVYKLFKEQGDNQKIDSLIEDFIQKDLPEKILEIEPRIIANYNNTGATAVQKEAYDNYETNRTNLIDKEINLWKVKEVEKYKKALALFTIPNLSEQSKLEVEELKLAAKENDLETVKTIIESNPTSIYTPANNGTILFHTAIQEGKEEIVDICLEKLKELNIPLQDPRLHYIDQSGIGHDPCDTALKSSNNTIKVIEKLINVDSDLISRVNSEGTTALHKAIEKGDKKVVKLFVNVLTKNDIPIENIKDGKRRNPLQFALEYRTEEIVHLLLNAQDQYIARSLQPNRPTLPYRKNKNPSTRGV